MRVAMFGAKTYERTLLDALNAGHRHELVYFDTRLGGGTTALANGFPAVSVFVNDVVDRDVLKQLAAGGTKLVATRSTGFNHIDLGAARELGVKVVRVTDYSPNSVAEFAVGLLLALNLAWILAPGTFGLSGKVDAIRLSFVSVAVWWLLFSIPLLRRVPEPRAVRDRGETGLERDVHEFLNEAAGRGWIEFAD